MKNIVFLFFTIAFGSLLASWVMAPSLSHPEQVLPPKVHTSISLEAWQSAPDPSELHSVEAWKPHYLLPQQDFVLWIQNSSTSDQSIPVYTSISTLVHLEKHPHHPDLLFVSFDDFQVDIQSNGKELPIPAVNRLLKGLHIEVQFDPLKGLGQDLPIPGANPQVQRMLSTLIDVLRLSYPPLSEHPGLCSWTWSKTWRTHEPSSSRGQPTIQATVSLSSRKNATVMAKQTIALQWNDKNFGARSRAEGGNTLRWKDSAQSLELIQSQGQFQSHLTASRDRQKIHQEMELQFIFFQCQSQTPDPSFFKKSSPIFRSPCSD